MRQLRLDWACRNDSVWSRPIWVNERRGEETCVSCDICELIPTGMQQIVADSG